MNLEINNTTCEDIIFNGHYLEKLYYNEHLVWEKQHANPYASQYFTIESLEDNNTVTLAHTEDAPTINSYYSLDNGTTWTQHATATEKIWVLNTGDKVLIKATADALATSSSTYNYFRSTKRFNVYGNSMSLLYGDNFANQVTLNGAGYNLAYLFYNATYLANAENLVLPATTAMQWCYASMFRGCTSLVTAPELPATTLYFEGCYASMFSGCTALATAPDLPAMTLADHCYGNMFYGCTSLTTAPELPATTLEDFCYEYMLSGCTALTTAPEISAITLASSCCRYMFEGCTSLVTAPELTATTLAQNCYQHMFDGCTSLTTAPELPATTLVFQCYASMFYGCTSLVTAPKLIAATLASGCYVYMFRNCTSLNEVVCLATDISATNCVNNWLTNVASTGTFYKDSSMSSWPSGSSGIPTNWTVQNYN